MNEKQKKQKSPKISLQLGEEKLARLKELADASEMSMSEYVRYYLDEPLERGAIFQRKLHYSSETKKKNSKPPETG